MYQRLTKRLMLLLVVLMVYQVNATFQCSAKIISALYINFSGSSNANLKNLIMSKLVDVQYSENMIVSSKVT